MSRRRYASLTLFEVTAPSTPASGLAEFWYQSDGRLYWKDSAGGVHGVVNEVAGTIGLVNASVIQWGTDTNLYRGAADVLKTDDAFHSARLILNEVSAPATPASGTAVIYVKSDGKAYIKDDAGVETDLTASGGPPTWPLDHTGAATDDLLTSRVTSDAALRFTINHDGKIEWGDGTAALDTNLYRVSSSILKTDGSLLIGSVIYFGAAGDTNLYRGAAGNLLITDDTFQTPSIYLSSPTGASDALTARIDGDTKARFTIDADGALRWGDGTADPDASIGRTNAGSLQANLAFGVNVNPYGVAMFASLAAFSTPAAAFYGQNSASGPIVAIQSGSSNTGPLLLLRDSGLATLFSVLSDGSMTIKEVAAHKSSVAGMSAIYPLGKSLWAKGDDGVARNVSNPKQHHDGVRQVISNPGLATFSTIGTTAPTIVSGIAAVNADSDRGTRVRISTTASINNVASMISTSVWRTAWGELMMSAIVEMAVITNRRVFIGWFSGAPSGSADPAVHHASFRFDTVAGDSNWMLARNDGSGGGTFTSSGVALATATRYELRVAIQGTRGTAAPVRLQYWINDLLIATVESASGNMPNSAAMHWGLYVTDINAAVATTLDIERVGISSLSA